MCSNSSEIMIIKESMKRQAKIPLTLVKNFMLLIKETTLLTPVLIVRSPLINYI